MSGRRRSGAARRWVSFATISLGPLGMLSNADRAVAADSAAFGLSTPDTPNHAEAKSESLGGRTTGSFDGGEMDVLRASETASLTAWVKAWTPKYAKLEGPLRARPRISPEAEHITAEVFEPPQSTQRYRDMNVTVQELRSE